MAVKLHRCPNVWAKLGGHPCWRVQKALDEQGIEYELVKGPLRPGKRDDLERLSGQRKYPVIEFEDGTVYRAESKDMAERIRSGRLLDDAARLDRAPSAAPRPRSPRPAPRCGPAPTATSSCRRPR